MNETHERRVTTTRLYHKDTDTNRFAAISVAIARTNCAIVKTTSNDRAIVGRSVVSQSPTNDVANWLYLATRSGFRVASLANPPIDDANPAKHQRENMPADECKHTR